MMPIAIRMTPTIPPGFTSAEPLERPPPGDQLDDQDDHRGQEDQVNEIPDGIDVDESQQRENQEHNKDSPEHMFSFELVFLCFVCRASAALKIFEKPREDRAPLRLLGAGAQI